MCERTVQCRTTLYSLTLERVETCQSLTGVVRLIYRTAAPECGDAPAESRIDPSTTDRTVHAFYMHAYVLAPARSESDLLRPRELRNPILLEDDAPQ